MSRIIYEPNEREKWQRALIDSALDATVLMNAAGDILDINSSAEKLFGFQKATIVGKKMVELIVPPQMQASQIRGMERLNTSGMNRILGQRLEVSARRSDGSDVQVELLVSEVDLSPSPVYVATFRDISLQKQTEEALRSSELRFRSVADSSPVMIWLAGFDGSISWFNRVWLDFTGRSMQDSCGFGWIDSVHPDDMEDLLRKYHAALDSRQSLSTEFRLQKMNGEYHWVLVNIAPMISPDGSWVGYVGSVVDINTRHLAEEELRLTRFALDRAGDCVFLINEDSSLHYVNDSACQSLDYSCEELLQLGFCDFNSEMTSNQWPHHWAKSKKLKQINLDTFLEKKDGTKFPVQISLNFIKFQGRELNCVVARDVTEQHNSKQALTKALHDAQAANQAKSEFLAIVSHEMRTPLNGILGMVELLLRTRVTDDQSGQLKVCRQSGNQLKTLIDDLLDFSLFQQGRFELQLEVFNLHNLLDQLRESFRDRIEKENVDFRWEIDPEVPNQISGDSKRLYQIIENFLSNATKFTSQGYISFLATVRSKQPEKAVLEFSVEDTGIGIKSEDRERIFNKFEQVDASSTRSHGGIGLGLAICRSLAKQMQGELGVESNGWGGSRFYFRAPFSIQTTKSRRLEDSKSLVNLSKTNDRFADLNVMLVDDDAPSRMVAKLILQQSGVTVSEATDGIDAVEQYKKTPDRFPVVFMDITMPRLDGINAMRQIRQLQGTRVSIIAMTALAMKGDREKLINEGFDEYIAKPITQATVFCALTKVLSRGFSKNINRVFQQARTHVVDLEKLTRHCGNDPDLISEIVARFAETCDESLEQISAGIVADDVDKVIDAAHRLRGSVGSMCGNSALEFADRFENTARNADLNGLKKDFPELYSVTQELRRTLDEHFGHVNLTGSKSNDSANEPPHSSVN